MKNSHLETSVFAGGCFWCTEAVFERLKGVESVMSGYTGGHKANPTYQQVCEGQTGHADAIKIVYDPALISYETLLAVFFATHDPTSLNRQGSDVGSQYRSAIFYTTEEQKHLAEEFMKKLQEEGVYEKPIVTELKRLTDFYEAEEYHRQYYEKNKEAPYCQLVINPKIEKLKERYAHLLEER
ncbi:MAG: peptide-methionine (S)-S-oxide reductase MsrA [Patescibacteria group bacterium]